jgi:hypothetical protein
MAQGDLLQVYDAAAKTKLWHNQLFEPNDDAAEVLGVTGISELHERLGKLVADRRTFSKVSFQTHGDSGRIKIGDDWLLYFEFLGNPAWRDAGYDKLFPFETKMIFGGCNVAEDDDGWKFLENAGKLLLRNGGGYTLGWTSLGFHLLGHDMHFWGSWKRVNFRGPFVTARYTSDDVVPDIKRPWDNRWR